MTTLNTQTWLRGLGGSGFGVFQGQGRFGLEFKAIGGAEAKAIRSSSPRARKAKILEPEMFGDILGSSAQRPPTSFSEKGGP